LRVEQFAREPRAVDSFEIWIAGILLIEAPHRGFEPHRVCWSKFWAQALVLLQNWATVTRSFEN
jgi:hypothetical protein